MIFQANEFFKFLEFTTVTTEMYLYCKQLCGSRNWEERPRYKTFQQPFFLNCLSRICSLNINRGGSRTSLERRLVIQGTITLSVINSFHYTTRCVKANINCFYQVLQRIFIEDILPSSPISLISWNFSKIEAEEDAYPFCQST